MYNYKQKPKNKSKKVAKKRLYVTAILAIVLLIGVAVIYSHRRANKPTGPTTIDGKINFQPASPVEKKDSEDAKDAIVKDQESQSAPSTSTPVSDQKKEVKPTITNTSGSINAYVSGIFEDGGTCTATFVKGSTTKTKSSDGFENASYTQCAPMTMETGFLSSGTWSLKVNYSSAKASGSSDIQKIEVQ